MKHHSLSRQISQRLGRLIFTGKFHAKKEVGGRQECFGSSPNMPPEAARPKSARGGSPRASSKSTTPRTKAGGGNPLGVGKLQAKPLGAVPGTSSALADKPAAAKPTLSLNTAAAAAADASRANSGRDSARKGSSSKTPVKASPRSSTAVSAALPSDRKLAKQDSSSKLAKADGKSSAQKSEKKTPSKKSKTQDPVGSPFAPRVTPFSVLPPVGLPALDLLNWTPVSRPPPVVRAPAPAAALAAPSPALPAASTAGLELEHRVLLEVRDNGLVACSIQSRYACNQSRYACNPVTHAIQSRYAGGALECGPSSENEFDDDEFDLSVSITPAEDGKWCVSVWEPCEELDGQCEELDGQEEAAATAASAAAPAAATETTADAAASSLSSPPPRPSTPTEESDADAVAGEAVTVAAAEPHASPSSSCADDESNPTGADSGEVKGEELDATLDFEGASAAAARRTEWESPRLNVKLIEVAERDQLAISIKPPAAEGAMELDVSACAEPMFDVQISVGDVQ